jgi:SRSO17 transposase
VAPTPSLLALAQIFVLRLDAGRWTLDSGRTGRGDTSQYGLQHLLSRAKCDVDAVRDDLRGYVVEQLGEDDVVLVVDETGDVKKELPRWACSVSTPAPPGPVLQLVLGSRVLVGA